MNLQKLKVRKERVLKMIEILDELFPGEGKTALRYSNPFELLVATILSAQTTDKKVNQVTLKLFKKYKRLQDYLKANLKDFQKDIQEIGLYRNKAKYILASAKIIAKKYKGKVPDSLEELVKLPGVGRKTANVVLMNAFSKSEGIPVDTHVRRFAIRFDLSDFKDPEKIEKDLMKIVPHEKWKDFAHKLIEYGKSICPARKHECKDHPLTKIYPKAEKVWPRN